MKVFFEIKGAVYTKYLGMCVVDKTELILLIKVDMYSQSPFYIFKINM